MAESDSHVKLRKAPLYRMICQMRFPQLLGFDNQAIRSIQKMLAEDYPEASRAQIVIGVEIGENARISPTSSELFRFIAVDEEAEISLTDQFVSLQTRKYQRFKDFAVRWENLIKILQSELDLSRQNRLGLRYTNVVQRQDIETVEGWTGLIGNHLLNAETSLCQSFGANAVSSQHQIRLRMPEGSFLFRYGSSPPPDDSEIPNGYVIDVDAYDDEAKSFSIDQQMRTLVTWNHTTYKLLQQAVTSELWSSFDPEV